MAIRRLNVFYTPKSKTMPKVHIVKLKGNKCKIYTAAVPGEALIHPKPGCKIEEKENWGRNRPNGLCSLCVCLPHYRTSLNGVAPAAPFFFFSKLCALVGFPLNAGI